MALPPHARAQLAAAEPKIRALKVGQVWWLPKDHVDYARPDRYCLLVALEPRGADLPARAHFI